MMEPVIYIIAFGLILIAQIFLSLRRNKLFGLIIPFLFLCYILYIAIRTAIYYGSIMTSFPLDGRIFLNTIGYIIPMLGLLLAHCICRFITRKRGGKRPA